MQKVSFWSRKGGVGKTTLALNLAAAAVNKGLKVAYVDLDSQGSALWLSELGKLPFDVLKKSPSGSYDLCVYDYPPNTEIKIEGEIVVVPYQPAALDIGATLKYIPTLKEQGFKVIEVINMVKNRADPKAYTLKQIKKGAIQVNDRSIYQRVTSYGTTVFNSDFTSKYGTKDARKEINQILEAVL